MVALSFRTAAPKQTPGQLRFALAFCAVMALACVFRLTQTDSASAVFVLTVGLLAYVAGVVANGAWLYQATAVPSRLDVRYAYAEETV